MPHQFLHRSDHSVVEMTIEVGALYRMTARKRSEVEKRNMHALHDMEVKEHYQDEVTRRLEGIPSELEEVGIVDVYRRMKEAVKEAAADGSCTETAADPTSAPRRKYRRSLQHN